MQSDVEKRRDLARCVQDNGDTIACMIVYSGERGREQRMIVPQKMLGRDKVRALCLASGLPKEFVLDRIESTQLVPASVLKIPVPIVRLWLPEGHARRRYVP